MSLLLRSQNKPAKIDDIVQVIRLALQGNPRYYLCHPDYWVCLDETVSQGENPCEYAKLHWVHHGFQGSCRLGESPSYIRESHILWERSDGVLVYLHFGYTPNKEPFVVGALSKDVKKILDSMSTEVYLKYHTETKLQERPNFMEPHPSPSPIRSPKPRVHVEEDTSTIASAVIREILEKRTVTPPPSPVRHEPPKLVRRPTATRLTATRAIPSSSSDGATAISPAYKTEAIGFTQDSGSMDEFV